MYQFHSIHSALSFSYLQPYFYLLSEVKKVVHLVRLYAEGPHPVTRVSPTSTVAHTHYQTTGMCGEHGSQKVLSQYKLNRCYLYLYIMEYTTKLNMKNKCLIRYLINF